MRNASKKLVPCSTHSIRRSLGMTMTVSTQPISSAERLLGLLHAALAFERERLGDHSDGERAEFAGEIGDHGRGAAAGAAAETRGDEHHVRAVERFENFFGVLERGFAADLGIRARAESFGELRAESAVLRAPATTSAPANRCWRR